MTSNPYTALFDENPHAGLPAREQEFRRKVDECAAWVAESERFPRTSERPWGKWLSHQRNHARGGKLSRERMAYLDENLPGWSAAGHGSDERFFARVDECAAWVAEHGRFPKQSDGSVGNFINNVRAQRDISPARTAYLDRFLSGWALPSDKTDAYFYAQVDGCAAWVAEHGQFPRTSDAPWGKWLIHRRQLARDGKLSPERLSYLDERLPGWSAPGPGSDEWFFASVEEGARWVAEHSRLPNRGDGSCWSLVNRSRQQAQAGSLSPERRAHLDEHLPGWDAPGRRTDEHFYAKVDECAAWAAQHGRLPTYSEPTGAWLTKTRSRAGRLSPERRAYLDEHLSGWDAPRRKSDEHFRNKADECAQWVAAHGRFPKAAEKPWGPWVDSRRREDRAGRLPPERRVYLDCVLPGWDGPLR